MPLATFRQYLRPLTNINRKSFLLTKESLRTLYLYNLSGIQKKALLFAATFRQNNSSSTACTSSNRRTSSNNDDLNICFQSIPPAPLAPLHRKQEKINSTNSSPPPRYFSEGFLSLIGNGSPFSFSCNKTFQIIRFNFIIAIYKADKIKCSTCLYKI